MSSFKFFSKNGDILPITEASISLFNIEYSYGYGVYETLKVRNTILYFIDQHLERLEHSAKVLEIKLPCTLPEIKQYLIDLISALNVDACNIKILLIGGEDTNIYIFASAPLYPDRKLYTYGAQVCTYIYERLFPTAKTLNMLPSYVAYKKARQNNCYDALLIDKNDFILEGTRTNFCAVKGKTIYRAPDNRVLGGVTFLTLSHVAHAEGFSIKQSNISIHDLPTYDGAFLTSTSTKLMPIKQIDDFIFPEISPVIKSLMKSYDLFLEKSNGVF